MSVPFVTGRTCHGVGTLAGHLGSSVRKAPHVDIGQIFFSGMSSLVGVLLASGLIHWRNARAERNWAAGRPVSVAGSIRRAERSRYGGRWRHGTIDVRGERVVWTPRTPWGRSMDLGGVGFGSQRSPHGPLRFQLPPAAVVVSCTQAERGYELAVLPGSMKYIFGAQFAT
jgi:hypothetical protein